MTATTADVTNCAPPNGSITASIDIPNVADYTFSWYNGASGKVTPDYTETSNVLSGIGAGVYTVAAFNNNVLGCDVQNPFTVTVKNAPYRHYHYKKMMLISSYRPFVTMVQDGLR